MSVLEAALLGFVQGVTEFLPISSSGHLVLLQELFGRKISDTIAFPVLLHVATLAAVAVVFRRDIVEIVTRKRAELGMLILGTVPAAVVGLTMKDIFEGLAGNILAVGLALVGTGLILSCAGWRLAKREPEEGMTWQRALIIGSAQAIAIMPGISRSGATISAAIMCGVMLPEAVRFSFLVAIPVIAGVALIKLKDIGSMGADAGWAPLVVGFVIAVFVGIAALRIVTVSVEKRKFPYFALYCIPVGLLVCGLALWGAGR